jgi:ankyrin repeat protein
MTMSKKNHEITFNLSKKNIADILKKTESYIKNNAVNLEYKSNTVTLKFHQKKQLSQFLKDIGSQERSVFSRPKTAIVTSINAAGSIQSQLFMLLNADMILVDRIDLAYKIYNDSKQLLQGKKINLKDKAMLSNVKMQAMQFLQKSLGGKNENDVITLMDNKAISAKNTVKPKNIPGKYITLTNLPNPNLSTTNIQYQWRNIANLALAKKRGKILTVNEVSRAGDVKDKNLFFSAIKRDSYRVLISGGELFFLKKLDLDKKCDTSEFVSHGKKGYAAFTVNTNGELSVFSHVALDKVVHSSLNSGAPLLFAGEAKITDGIPRVLHQHSGHYTPSVWSMFEMLKYFKQEPENVDISKCLVRLFKPLPSNIALETQKTPDGEYESDMHYYYKAEDLFKRFHEIEQEINKIKNNINADQIAKDKLLCLVVAAENLEAMQILINQKANFSQEVDGVMLLESDYVVDALLGNPNSIDDQGRTALHHFCGLSPNFKNANKLLEAGANPNLEDEEGYPPIAYALGGGELKLAKLLLDNKAVIDVKSDWFEEIKSQEDNEIMNFLLEEGVFGLEMDEKSESPSAVSLEIKQEILSDQTSNVSFSEYSTVKTMFSSLKTDANAKVIDDNKLSEPNLEKTRRGSFGKDSAG